MSPQAYRCWPLFGHNLLGLRKSLRQGTTPETVSEGQESWNLW